MLVHVVRQGECLAKIAATYGFRDYRTVYDHADNEELRALRPDPNVLHPGDRVAIPDKAAKDAPIATARSHRFQMKSQTKVLRLVLLQHGDEPIADAPWTLELDGPPLEGKTDGDGALEVEVPVTASSARLLVAGRALVLRLGALNPVEETPDRGATGAQSRLRNLGYDVGPVDGRIGRRTRMTLALLQSEQGLEVTGKLDDATRAKLVDLHGS